MTDHDVMEVRVIDSGCVLVCRCGWVIDGYNQADVGDLHAVHFGIETARAQLQGDADASDS